MRTGWFTEATRTRYLASLRRFHRAFEYAGAFCTFVGNMWVFDENSCAGSGASEIYIIALVLLIISYIQVFLTCFFILWWVRILRTLAEPVRGERATQDA